jgi:pilus assembly protein CpaE
VGDEVAATLKRVLPSDHGGNEQSGSGLVYALAGTSGGVGTTTLTSHVAVALASEGKRVILVDHHRRLGHVALYLNLANNGRSIYDLITNESRLDDSLLSSYVMKHETGLDVLCSPDSANSPTAAMDNATFRKVISFLRLRYDYILFDSAAGDPELAAVAAEAERIFLVTSAEIAPMRDLLRYADVIGKEGEKYRIVVNHEGRSLVTSSDVASRTGLEVAAKFEELPANVPAATNTGKMVDLEVRSFHDSLNALLNAIAPSVNQGQPKQQRQEKKTGWFSFFGGKKG